MGARIIDGKATAATIRKELAGEVATFRDRHRRAPGLAAVLVGEDSASQVYVRNKKKACEEVGMAAWVHNKPADLTQTQLMDLVAELNADERVDGILVQLPLPKGLDEQAVIAAIAPEKDVDGFHPMSAGALMTGLPGSVPCTPAGVIELLDRYDIPIEGKNAVVVGRSNIVGKPAALLLLARNATVTVCHSRTANLSDEIRRADIVVAAVGRAKMIKGADLKPGCAVIDVGMNRDENGKLCGDVEFASASEVAAAITPVPGGVGPMTIALLLSNTLTLARHKLEA